MPKPKIQHYATAYDYLKTKISPTDYECIYKDTNHPQCMPDKIECNVCWWRAATIPLRLIPQCAICKEDLKRFNQMSKESRQLIYMDHLSLSAKNKIFKLNCGKKCLWFDWFESMRDI